MAKTESVARSSYETLRATQSVVSALIGAWYAEILTGTEPDEALRSVRKVWSGISMNRSLPDQVEDHIARHLPKRSAASVEG